MLHRKQGIRAHNIVQDFGSVCAGRIIFKVKGESISDKIRLLQNDITT